MDEALQSEEIPKYIDIRRYFRQYCGICRSKKTLITSHINSHHMEEVENERVEKDPEAEGSVKSNTCEKCGASFKKHAYLLQHMRSHHRLKCPWSGLTHIKRRCIGTDELDSP